MLNIFIVFMDLHNPDSIINKSWSFPSFNADKYHKNILQHNSASNVYHKNKKEVKYHVMCYDKGIL